MNKPVLAAHLLFWVASATVAATDARATTFTNPSYRGHSLDWCYVFENQCGRPAANRILS